MTGDPVLIEAAINGGTTKERNPTVPLSPDEIRNDALRCLDAGATIIHAHNHDIRLSGEAAARAYLDAWAPLLAERPDALWYPTLCVAPDPLTKLEHVRLIAEEVPLTMAAVDPGSTNLGSPGDDGPPRRWRVRELVRRHPRGVRLLRRAPPGPAARDLRARIPAVRAHLPPRRSSPRRLDGEALLRRRVGHVGPGPRRHLRAAPHRPTRCSPTSTCSRAPGCRGRCRYGAATSWRRQWRGWRSNSAATSTSASKSTSTPTASPPTPSWSRRRWR